MQPEAPVAFLFPGLIDDDPNFDKAWDPLRRTFRVIRVSYLDWTELIKPESDIAALIAHLKRQIEQGSESGVLRLIGYSVGGLWAYACALEFQAEGRGAIRLAILDAPAHIEKFSLSFSKRMRNRIRGLLKFRLRSALASVAAKSLISRPLRPLLGWLARFRHTPLPFNFDWYLHRKLTMQLELRLFRAWWQTMLRPTSLLLAPTFIFRSTDYDNFKDEYLGWKTYCPNCAVIRVAGDHGSMLHAEHAETLIPSIVKTMEPEEDLGPGGRRG